MVCIMLLDFFHQPSSWFPLIIEIFQTVLFYFGMMYICVLTSHPCSHVLPYIS